MQLTSICHGEATAHVHHVHLRHELGDVVVMREGEAEHLIFVRAGGEEPACQTDSQHHTEQCRETVGYSYHGNCVASAKSDSKISALNGINIYG
jgi:hypothetical protein